MTRLCPDVDMRTALESVTQGAAGGLARIEGLLARYADDPRLHFLKGSILASSQQYPDAINAMRTALQIEPDYPIARFQLGLLQLSSGDAMAATTTWGPLSLLPENHYLHLFVRGLHHMMRDEFDAANASLEAGIVANTELAATNRDMRLLISEMQARTLSTPTEAQATGDKMTDPTSPTHFLLNMLRPKGRPH